MLRIITVLLGLIGLVFLTVGLFFILGALPQAYLIRCQRPEPNLVNCRSEYRIAGIVTQKSRLNRLQKASMASAYSGDVDGNLKHYQVNLVGAESSIS